MSDYDSLSKWESEQTRREISDLRSLDDAQLEGLDFASRRHVIQGSIRLAGMMGDAFHRLEHRDDIPWEAAPLPPSNHACTPWSREWFGLAEISHCACGAVCENIRQEWSQKNSRRAPGCTASRAAATVAIVHPSALRARGRP